MLSYERDAAVQSAITHFGRIGDGKQLQVDTPAFAPTPRMRYEARAVLRLVKGGGEVQVLIVPLSTRREVVSELAPLIPDSRQLQLDTQEKPTPARLVLPDVESEVFALSCDARRRLLSDQVARPRSVKELLCCGLTSSSKKQRKETGDAWTFVDSQYKLATIGNWMERLEMQARATVFLSPAPIVRALPGYARRALDMGWRIVDTIQETAFQGRGVQLLLHSDLFVDDPIAEAERRALLSGFQNLYQSPSPRNNPYIAIKFLDKGHLLTRGPQQSVARGHLKDFVFEAGEHLARANGVLVVHNYGAWTLSAFDSGADIVGARGTGDLLEIDDHFGTQKPKKRGGQMARGRHRLTGAWRKKIRVNPFDPMGLCDVSVKEADAFWKRWGAVTVAEHVTPVEWAKLDVEQRREYRAMQVFGGLLDIAKQLRAAAKGNTPVRDAVRDRVGRMKDQDPMVDLCPSFEGV